MLFAAVRAGPTQKSQPPAGRAAYRMEARADVRCQQDEQEHNGQVDVRREVKRKSLRRYWQRRVVDLGERDRAEDRIADHPGREADQESQRAGASGLDATMQI
jgi:hypothetical protein